MQEIIQMQCGECKRRNYSTTKNKKNTPDKLERKKYCPWCRHHTVHKEVK
ncbi:50S ribosomal protein L33 [bacterium]|jgi:large subunit ribosomal protein L33|nr:50S ribosomal protein L33 [bacterium]MCI0601737.1 50S ribosomal protein L33 [bacterium]